MQLSYAIGVAEPISIFVDFGGTGQVSEELVEEAVRVLFDLTPRGIIKMLDLLRPIYLKTASYGHFGRELSEFTWERTDKKDQLQEWFGKSQQKTAKHSSDKKVSKSRKNV